MELKSQDIKNHISNTFGLEIKKDGFVYKKTNNEFVLIDGDYKFIFNIELTAWSTSYELNVHLRISQKEIENILETILGKQRHRLTLNQEMLERLYYSPDGRKNGKGESLGVWMTKNEDILPLDKILKSYYENIAMPYFKLFSNLEAFDDYMNNPPFEYPPAYIGGALKNRCMKGLIVAKLVQNPNYDELVATYDKWIKATISDVQPDAETNYIRVRNYMREHFH
jgi:hypothetical protein